MLIESITLAQRDNKELEAANCNNKLDTPW